MERVIELIADLISKPAFGGFVGVLAGGAITWLREWMKERQERGRELAYASSLISAELYRFVSSCSEVAGDSGRPDELGHYYPNTDQPTLSMQGIDVEWRSMPAQLVDRILSLPNNLNWTGLGIPQRWPKELTACCHCKQFVSLDHKQPEVLPPGIVSSDSMRPVVQVVTKLLRNLCKSGGHWGVPKHHERLCLARYLIRQLNHISGPLENFVQTLRKLLDLPATL